MHLKLPKSNMWKTLMLQSRRLWPILNAKRNKRGTL